VKNIGSQLKNLGEFDDFENILYYAEAFYGYEFTKYYYEKTGTHRHISVVTEGYGENTNDFLLKKDDAINMLGEFFINLKYNLQNDYDINEEAFCCAADEWRFTSIICSCEVFALLNKNADKVYILEYFT
jgi:hypothetical protein